MKMMNNDIVLFETKDKEIKLSVSVDNDTVWLSANQMALLFDRDERTIRKHINNVFNENELDRTNNTQKMRVVGVKQKVPFYTLDVIISVGYRVKSQRGTEFRQWANGVLKQYIIQGYALNEKRLQALEKTVEIQTKMLADALDVEEADATLEMTMNLYVHTTDSVKQEEIELLEQNINVLNSPEFIDTAYQRASNDNIIRMPSTKL